MLLRGQAKAAPVGDLSKWSEALTTAETGRVPPGRGRALGGVSSPDWKHYRPTSRTRAGRGRPRAAEADRDRKFLERLMMIELEVRTRSELGAKWADSAYFAAFREFGIDLEKVDPTEAGRFLASRSALRNWPTTSATGSYKLNMFRTRKERQIRLIKMADVADPDPWRSKIRKQLTGSDYETARQMARDEKTISAQPVSGLLLLASDLSESSYFEGGGAITRGLLQKAWRLQPDSFLVCNALGLYRGYAEDLGNEDLNVRFCTSAVALRPDSALAHSRLANELVTLYEIEPEFWDSIVLPSVSERLQEAIREFREAVRLRPEVGSFHRDLGCALFLTEGGHDEAVRGISQVDEARS